jgi:hypothetical protein
MKRDLRYSFVNVIVIMGLLFVSSCGSSDKDRSEDADKVVITSKDENLSKGDGSGGLEVDSDGDGIFDEEDKEPFVSNYPRVLIKSIEEYEVTVIGETSLPRLFFDGKHFQRSYLGAKEGLAKKVLSQAADLATTKGSSYWDYGKLELGDLDVFPILTSSVDSSFYKEDFFKEIQRMKKYSNSVDGGVSAEENITFKLDFSEFEGISEVFDISVSVGLYDKHEGGFLGNYTTNYLRPEGVDGGGWYEGLIIKEPFSPLSVSVTAGFTGIVDTLIRYMDKGVEPSIKVVDFKFKRTGSDEIYTYKEVLANVSRKTSQLICLVRGTLVQKSIVPRNSLRREFKEKLGCNIELTGSMIHQIVLEDQLISNNFDYRRNGLYRNRISFPDDDIIIPNFEHTDLFLPTKVGEIYFVTGAPHRSFIKTRKDLKEKTFIRTEESISIGIAVYGDILNFDLSISSLEPVEKTIRSEAVVKLLECPDGGSCAWVRRSCHVVSIKNESIRREVDFSKQNISNFIKGRIGRENLFQDERIVLDGKEDRLIGRLEIKGNQVIFGEVSLSPVKSNEMVIDGFEDWGDCNPDNRPIQCLEGCDKEKREFDRKLWITGNITKLGNNVRYDYRGEIGL